MFRFHASSLVLAVLASVAAALTPVAAPAAETAGKVSRLSGVSQVSRGGASTPLKLGDTLEVGHVITTATDARLELSMIDGATLTLGPSTVLEIESYLFDQNKGNGALKLLRGALQAVSGQLAHLSNKPFTVAGPVATIGIRGTTFFAGDIDNTFGVFLIEGTGVYVQNAAGSVELSRPGLGTTVPAGRQAPEDPRQWAPDKVQRSLALTSF